jgi:pimeloyl-[acyl-carrier protein] methyl ester esterase
MYIEREGIRLYVETNGVGKPPLLFIHGWLTNADIWKYQTEEFSKSYQVITLDLRGFGRSDKPQVEYTFDLFAEDIDFIVEKLRIDKPVFIGWSKGASIGLVYAASKPERLSKLVLVGGGPKFVASDDYEHGLLPEEFNHMVDLMSTDYERGVRNFIDDELPEPGTEQLKKWIFDLAMQTPSKVALNSIINDSKYDLRPILQKIKLPTLICYGEFDSICPPGNSVFLHSGIDHSEIHVFKGLGHIPFLTDPASFNSLLLSFLSK